MKKYLILPLTALTFLTVASPVFAVEAVNSDRSMERQIRTELRCDVSDARVDLIIGRYDVAYPRHVENYKKVAARVAEVVGTLKQNGKDTSKLEAVLRVFNDKVKTFDEQAKAVVAQLKVAQQYACGESQGKYAEEIKKARDLAVTAHATLLDLRSYYQNSVRPEIQALRTQ